MHIDFTGPWEIHHQNDISGEITMFKLDLLTMSDAFHGWTEFAMMKNKAAKYVTIMFDVNWLCQYPRPEHLVYHNGNEFIGWEF